jgi:hypothetical protein
MVKKPTPGEWRMTLDFVQLNAATRGLEGWPIPNIQQTLSRLGTLKRKLFGLLDFTAGYHQIPLDPASRAYQLKESGPYFQRSISNTVLTDLIFLEVTVTPILLTDASDYGVGGYLYSVTNGKVRVIRFFSKALVGTQLNWSAREKECYGIYFGVKTFEDLLDNRHFIMKTDYMNLTYLNVTLTGKVLR